MLFVRPSPLSGEGRSRVGAIFLLLLFGVFFFFFPRAQTPESAGRTARRVLLAVGGTLAGG